MNHSRRDGQLAEKVRLRADVPLHLFRESLARATEDVRARMIAAAAPGIRDQIDDVLAAIAEATTQQASSQSEQDFAKAEARLIWMQSVGELNDAAIVGFAKSGSYAEIIAAIALLCRAPLKVVAELLHSERREAYLIPCKAAGLEWPTASIVLTSRCFGRCRRMTSLRRRPITSSYR